MRDDVFRTPKLHFLIVDDAQESRAPRLERSFEGYLKNCRLLEKEAVRGLDCRPHMTIEIEATRSQLDQLRAQVDGEGLGGPMTDRLPGGPPKPGIVSVATEDSA